MVSVKAPGAVGLATTAQAKSLWVLPARVKVSIGGDLALLFLHVLDLVALELDIVALQRANPAVGARRARAAPGDKVAQTTSP